ncbi:hypothetical protein A3A63_02265 [Candidatus Gottesmanbacteria bacterium RIFCSPLOWO2_01_FULL_46_9]|uniref:LytR/CpsA/Psr regulator C-terminal domain-containing protein n=1 Tax=Candidatus Gottesmanbacteria bacterium RIFCSPLOWO2_01_FULL_46_9 TaxID=1798394 RepID=A0A1F6B347_9BACT|nr:MAG: hypothetical protein A3A63_02265 [Candidatus Gottesmanbacteria bacterium RIFCSPLOWO2_01_FULL_46_9]
MALEAPEIPKFPPIKKEYMVVVALIIFAVVPSVFFYTQYQMAKQRLANPAQFAAEEGKKLVDAVSKLMTLPGDEVPTVATVNDKEKLKNQPFFANTENGDKVLIYTNAKKAILYRPSINKIIDVAPVNIGPTNASESAQIAAVATPAVPAVKFVLRNGTNIVGLTKKLETELKGIMKNADIIDKDNAKRRDYEKSIIIDIKGNKAAQAAQIAKDVSIIVGSMPEGESTPSADFLVILGTDKK